MMVTTAQVTPKPTITPQTMYEITARISTTTPSPANTIMVCQSEDSVKGIYVE